MAGVTGLRIDGDLCAGHGRCYLDHPELFDEDDAGNGVVLRSEVDGPALDAAREAARNCPEGAVRLD